MKKILVASDLSERADMALGRAVVLAQQSGAEITVLFAVPDDLPDDVLEQFMRSGRDGVAAQIGRVCPGAEVGIHPMVLPGSDWLAILETAQLGGHDVIILGTHRMGRDGFSRGATVERVIAHANVPVLVVPRRAAQPYRRPVVGFDFSIHSRRALKLTRVLAPEIGIVVVHAWQQPFKAFLHDSDTRKQLENEEAERFKRLVKEEFAEFAAEQPDARNGVEFIMRQGDAGSVLETVVAEQEADLLALGTHGGGGFREAVVGSVAKSFLRFPTCDVAVIKAW